MARPTHLLIACLLALPACTPRGDRGGTAPPPPPPSVYLSAVPSYRLVLGPDEPGVSSRLLVLHVQVEGIGDETIRFDCGDFRLRFPDGTIARVFDPPRAAVLVRRTRLVPASPAAGPAGPDKLAAALPPRIEDDLKRELILHLFAAGEVRRGEVRQGYLVTDTGALGSSLDGAVIEATTTNPDGTRVVRDTFPFSRSEAAAATSGPR